MSQENVDIVRRVFDANARRDTAAVLALYDPEVEWDNSGEGMTEPGVYRGHAGLRKWFRQWSESWEEVVAEHGELIDCGENVVSAVTMKGRGRASGADVEWTQYAIWTIRDRLIAQVVSLQTRQEALEAVGLRE